MLDLKRTLPNKRLTACKPVASEDLGRTPGIPGCGFDVDKGVDELLWSIGVVEGA